MNSMAFARRDINRGPITELEPVPAANKRDAIWNSKGGGWFEAIFADGSNKQLFGADIITLDMTRIGAEAVAA